MFHVEQRAPGPGLPCSSGAPRGLCRFHGSVEPTPHREACACSAVPGRRSNQRQLGVLDGAVRTRVGTTAKSRLRCAEFPSNGPRQHEPRIAEWAATARAVRHASPLASTSTAMGVPRGTRGARLEADPPRSRAASAASARTCVAAAILRGTRPSRIHASSFVHAQSVAEVTCTSSPFLRIPRWTQARTFHVEHQERPRRQERTLLIQWWPRHAARWVHRATPSAAWLHLREGMGPLRQTVTVPSRGSSVQQNWYPFRFPIRCPSLFPIRRPFLFPISDSVPVPISDSVPVPISYFRFGARPYFRFSAVLSSTAASAQAPGTASTRTSVLTPRHPRMGPCSRARVCPPCGEPAHPQRLHPPRLARCIHHEPHRGDPRESSGWRFRVRCSRQHGAPIRTSCANRSRRLRRAGSHGVPRGTRSGGTGPHGLPQEPSTGPFNERELTGVDPRASASLRPVRSARRSESRSRGPGKNQVPSPAPASPLQRDQSAR